MTNYYFVAALLPPIILGQKPEMSIVELSTLLDVNLKPDDLKKIQILRTLYDIYNLRSMWLGHPIDKRGNLAENELQDALVHQSGLPNFVFDYAEKYEGLQQRLKNFPWLVHQYFEKSIAQSSGFLKKLLSFEREYRLVMVGFRAKQLGVDVSQELQFEDPNDMIVAQILAQKDAKTYDPPEEYQKLKAIFESRFSTPLELQESLFEYRFNKIEEMIEGETFSIDRILGYVVQLVIAEQWDELNTKEGLKIVDSIVKETK